jgi:hypothetical protein
MRAGRAHAGFGAYLLWPWLAYLLYGAPTQCRDAVFVGALVVLLTEVRENTNTARMILTWE